MFRKQNGELEQGHKRKSHGQCVLEYRDQEFIRVLQRLKRQQKAVCLKTVEETKEIDPKCECTSRPFSTENERNLPHCHQ